MLRSAIIAVLAVTLAVPAAAAKGGKGKGAGHGGGKGKGHHGVVIGQGHGHGHASGKSARRVHRGRRNVKRVVRVQPRLATSSAPRQVLVFSGRDRGVVRTYFASTYGRGNCPPGLAKKNNGCLPPGIASKRYVVGRPLPMAVLVQPLPPVLLTRLTPVPVGYQYVVVDGDVLKLALASRLVVDAIRFLD